MKITFLGTGTSHGVPMIGCTCAVCTSPDPRNKRFRSSILVEASGFRVMVDTTPDFRVQCLRAGLSGLDAIVYTHEHSDHILGLDDLRRFNLMQGKRTPVYGSPKVLEYLRRIFPYAIQNPSAYAGLPQIDLNLIEGPFEVGPFRLTPYQMPHGSTETFGFRFERDGDTPFAYLTDCKEVSTEIRRKLTGIPLLILDALRPTPHPTHLSIGEALEVVREIRPGRAFFTHMAHDLDHETANRGFPEGVAFAHDGLVVEI